jgi:ATP-binding cassette subfamily B protein
MRLLYSYLRQYKSLIALALALATINQVFSLLDPLIFRYVIDEYATRYQEYSTGEFFRGVSLLLGAAVGVAFVSRVAKNFQDYVISVITQRLGAQLYADGIRHSLDLPYATFEDQRSGETLGKLQKVLMIAHRLSTVLSADRIYVLEQGRIVESGRHDQLLEQMGLYYAMWRQQIGERRAAAMPVGFAMSAR